jgi:hypothetical protein
MNPATKDHNSAVAGYVEGVEGVDATGMTALPPAPEEPEPDMAEYYLIVSGDTLGGVPFRKPDSLPAGKKNPARSGVYFVALHGGD